MKTVTIVQGLPGSGKSTRVLKKLRDFKFGRAARINNDTLAEMLFGDKWVGIDTDGKVRGKILADVRCAILQALLKNDYVDHVFIDNTNLYQRAINEIGNVAFDNGAYVEMDKTCLDISVEECIWRDEARDRPVGQDVIRRMAKALPGAHRAAFWNPPVPQAVEPDESLPRAYIVDIDGTVAIMADRNPYDYDKVWMDTPNQPVVDVVSRLAAGSRIIFISGRSEDCYEMTYAWLKKAFPFSPFNLHMRTSKDMRRDSVVKHELFQKHVEGQYYVAGVFDDRDQVVRLWRKLGLPTFQVNDGAF